MSICIWHRCKNSAVEEGEPFPQMVFRQWSIRGKNMYFHVNLSLHTKHYIPCTPTHPTLNYASELHGYIFFFKRSFHFIQRKSLSKPAGVFSRAVLALLGKTPPPASERKAPRRLHREVLWH